MSGNTYSKKEDDYLCNYIAEARPNEAGRQGNTVYKALVENVDKWPWAKSHTWQGWREHYKLHKEEFDQKIRKIQKERGIQPVVHKRDAPQSSQRAAFTDTEDKLLVKYLARHNPQLRGRSGNDIYKQLVENKDKRWNWSQTHSWHSWRHRYVSRQDSFDRKIGKYIERHNIPVPSTPRSITRHRDDERPTKRQKTINDLDTQEERLANLVASTPSLQEKKSGEARIKEEPFVKKESPVSTDQVKEVRPTSISETVKVKEEDNSSNPSEDEDETKVPPGSDDYGGEIFDDAEEDKAENGVKPQSRGDAGDERDKDAEPGLVISNNHPNASPQHPAEAPTKNGVDSSAQVTENDGAFQSPPKPPLLEPPSKARPHINHNSFTLASQSRRPKDDDPFEDSPPAAKQERAILTTKKRPQTFREGPYGTRLNGKPQRGGSSTEDSDSGAPDAQRTWPPRRGGTKVSQVPQEIKVEKEHPEHQATEQRRREKGKGKAGEEDIAPEVDPQEDVQNSADASELLPDEVLEPTKPRTSCQGVAQGVPDAGLSRIVSLKRTRTDIFGPLPRLTETSITKRYSSGDATDISPLKDVASLPASRSGTRTINLRQELANRNLNHSTRRPSSRASYASHASGISEEDSSVLQELGIQMAIQKFSEEFGFTEVVVQKIWNSLRSLRLLKNALTDMKESAERKMSEWVEGASVLSRKSISGSPTASVVKSKSELMARYISAATPSIEPTSAPGSSSAKHRRRYSVDVGGRSLDIRPVDPLEVSAAMEVEYEPLTGTRAGKYARLVKLGREDEALEREQRRVSSVAYSPRRSLLLQENTKEARAVDSQGDGMNGEAAEDEVEIEIQDEEGSQVQDEEMRDVQKQQDAMNEEQGEVHPDILEDHDVDMDSPAEQRPTNHNRQRGKRRELDEEDPEQEISSQHQQPQENGNDHEQPSEGESEDEEFISIKSEFPEDKGKVEASERSDVERWKEVEHLFLAANCQIIGDLREIEKNFNPSLLMRWIADQVAMI